MKNNITYLLLFLSVNLFAQSSWVNYANDHIIYDLAIENNQLWVGTQGGLVQLDIQTGEKEIYQAWNSGLKGTGIKEVEISSSGKKWLGGENGGLFSFDGENWEHFYHINTGDTLIEIVNLQLDFNEHPWFISNINGNCGGCQKLISYDGNEFINHFDIVNQATPGRIVDFAFIDTEEMWIAYDNGSNRLVKYNGVEVTETFDTINSPMISNERINQIEIDNQGNLWLTCYINNAGTYAYRILKYDGLNWSVEDENAPGYARRFFQDKDDNLWFEFYHTNTQVQTYASYDGLNWTYWTSADVPTIPNTNGSKPYLRMVDMDGNWWMVSFSGIFEPKVYKVNGPSFTAYDTQISRIGWNYNVNIGVDCDNNVWSGTSKFNGTNWEHFDRTQTGFNGTIQETAIDPTNCNLWVAMNGNNGSSGTNSITPLGKYNGTDFETIPLIDGKALGIDISDDGIIYVATTDLGLARNINGNWSYFSEWNSPLHNYVRAVKVTSNGIVWASSYGNGLARRVGTTWTVFNSSNSPVGDHVYRIYLDHDENVWVRSGTGLAKFDGTDWEVFPFEVGPYGLTSIKEDHRGNYWLGTWNGALYWDGYDYTVFDISNSNIGSNIISDIHIDPINGNIWFLHGTGLSVLKKFHVGENLSGISFFDANQDGIFDNSEDVRLPGQNILLLPDSTTAITNSLGAYSFHPEDTGNYQLVFEPNLPYIHVPPNSIDTVFSGETIEGINFGAWTENLPEGISIDITNGPLVCNNESNIWVTIKNEGFLNISGEIRLSFPSQFTYASSDPAVATNASSEVSWLFEDLSYLECRGFKLVLNVPGVDALNQDFQFIAEMITDNQRTSTTDDDQVLCSYDPNDKAATPVGESSENYSLLNDPIQYKIRFQNMGNYLAQDIVVTDEIDPSLDLSTFEVIASSHEMTTTIKSGNQLVFRFDDINLPPEEQDFLGSQGFIKYQISPKEGLLDPTVIQNFANIYFDLNPPIVTNTTENILVETLPTVSTTLLNLSSKAMVYPNPASAQIWIEWPAHSESKDWSVDIYDIFGKLLQHHDSASDKHSMRISDTGFYILKIQKDDYYQIEKVVVQ